jgi:hypothetical protein
MIAWEGIAFLYAVSCPICRLVSRNAGLKQEYRMEDLAAFIDEVYEAAVVPELWPKVLDGLTEIGDGYGALMFAGDGEFQRPLKARPPQHSWRSTLPRAGICATGALTVPRRIASALSGFDIRSDLSLRTSRPFPE